MNLTFSIRKKLITAFSILLGLMIAIFAIAFVRFREMNSRMTEITNVTAHKVLLIGQIKHDITAISRDQKNMIATVDDDGWLRATDERWRQARSAEASHAPGRPLLKPLLRVF